MVNGQLERREEAIDLALGHRLNCVKAGKRQPWTPITWKAFKGKRLRPGNGLDPHYGL